jgi:thioredoxin-related protein
MKKGVYIFLLSFCAIPLVFAQPRTYTFEQVDSLQQIQNRKIVVFIHTDWCKYCQAMKNSTFKTDSVIQILNENYYFVTLNAEEKRTIAFRNQTFYYRSNGNSNGIHDLAYLLANQNNQTVYPTLCVLNENNQIVFQKSNYLNAKELSFVLEELKK